MDTRTASEVITRTGGTLWSNSPNGVLLAIVCVCVCVCVCACVRAYSEWLLILNWRTVFERRTLSSPASLQRCERFQAFITVIASGQNISSTHLFLLMLSLCVCVCVCVCVHVCMLMTRLSTGLVIYISVFLHVRLLVCVCGCVCVFPCTHRLLRSRQTHMQNNPR